jgi:hypothetical protein
MDELLDILFATVFSILVVTTTTVAITTTTIAAITTATGAATSATALALRFRGDLNRRLYGLNFDFISHILKLQSGFACGIR